MKKSTKRLLSFMATLLISLFSAYAMAQTAIIKGIVKDASGNPLSGASVTVEPKNIGTTTDAMGMYSLKVPAGSYTLVISFVGQETQRMGVVVKASETVEKNGSLTTIGSGESVMVVGSRSTKPRTIISTPVPVDIISAKEIKQFAQADLSQMLTYAAPSFQSTHQSVTDGTDAIDPASLRGLGPDQTLVLLNGKRRHTTALVNINGSVGRGSVGTDLNAIPSAAIDHIEVLRDGAAALYGSDAIAGVINVVLKKKFKGINLTGTLGQNMTSMPYTQYYSGQATHMNINDGTNKQIDFSAGTFAKSGAYVNISGQWLQRDQTNRSGEDNGPLQYIGTSASSFPTAPTTALGTGTSAQYRTWLMDQDQAIQTARNYSRRNMIVGQASNNNFGAFANAGIPITKNIDFYTTIGGSSRTGQSEGNYRNANSISQAPQLLTQTSATQNSFGGPGLGNWDYYSDGFLPQIHTTIIDYSAIAGFKAKFGDWSVDLSNTYGFNSLHYYVENSGNASIYSVPQKQFDAGVQKFSQNTINLDIDREFNFGTKNSLNVAFGGEARHERFALVAGEPNSWNAGNNLKDSTIAPGYTPGGGVAYTLTAVPGSGAQVFPGLQPSNALDKNRNVYAGYADLEYTIGKLLIGAAARVETYKETSASLTYTGTGTKVNARYEITPNLAVRGSVGTGFRAPSLHQRYYNSTSTQFVNGNPQNSLTANNQSPIVTQAFGINELKPETSTDYTFGITSKFGNGFIFSVDGYYISIKDRIVLSSAFSGSATTTSSNPLVDTIFRKYNVQANSVQFWTNAINTDTKGIDIVLSKSYRAGQGRGMVSLAANFNQNSVVGSIHTNSAIDAAANNPYSSGNLAANPANDFKNILFDRQQRARIEHGSPNNKINLTATYSLKKWDFMARAVRFGEVTELNNVANNPFAQKPDGTYWNDVNFASDQKFSAKVTTDLIVTYRFMPGLGLTLGANNLFDVYPDPIFIDPRNSYANVHSNPVAGANKAAGGYGSGRDVSNRGRFLFTADQFGYNGRYLFARISVDISTLAKKH